MTAAQVLHLPPREPPRQPPIDSEVDLRSYPRPAWSPELIFKGAFWSKSNAEEFRAGLKLRFEAWSQRPAGSLPDDDDELCDLAGFGRDMAGWLAVKEGALHGWYRASDGRLYHDDVAADVQTAWELKKDAVKRRGNRWWKRQEGAKKRARNLEKRRKSRVAEPVEKQDKNAKCTQRSFSLRSKEHLTESPELRSGPRGKPQAPLARDDFLQNRGEDLLGQSKAGLVVAMRQAHGDKAVEKALGDLERKGATIRDRAAFFRRCLEPKSAPPARSAPEHYGPKGPPPSLEEMQAAFAKWDAEVAAKQEAAAAARAKSKPTLEQFLAMSGSTAAARSAGRP